MDGRDRYDEAEIHLSRRTKTCIKTPKHSCSAVVKSWLFIILVLIIVYGVALHCFGSPLIPTVVVTVTTTIWPWNRVLLVLCRKTDEERKKDGCRPNRFMAMLHSSLLYVRKVYRLKSEEAWKKAQVNNLPELDTRKLLRRFRSAIVGLKVLPWIYGRWAYVVRCVRFKCYVTCRSMTNHSIAWKLMKKITWKINVFISSSLWHIHNNYCRLICSRGRQFGQYSNDYISAISLCMTHAHAL